MDLVAASRLPVSIIVRRNVLNVATGTSLANSDEACESWVSCNKLTSHSCIIMDADYTVAKPRHLLPFGISYYKIEVVALGLGNDYHIKHKLSRMIMCDKYLTICVLLCAGVGSLMGMKAGMRCSMATWRT